MTSKDTMVRESSLFGVEIIEYIAGGMVRGLVLATDTTFKVVRLKMERGLEIWTCLN